MVSNLNNLLPYLSRPINLIFIFSIVYVFSLPPFGVSIFYYVSFSIIFFNILTNDNFSKKYIFYFFLFTQIITLSWITQSFYSGGFGYLLLGIILVGVLSIFIAFLHYSATILILVSFKKKITTDFLITTRFIYSRNTKGIYFRRLPLES